MANTTEIAVIGFGADEALIEYVNKINTRINKSDENFMLEDTGIDGNLKHSQKYLTYQTYAWCGRCLGAEELAYIVNEFSKIECSAFNNLTLMVVCDNSEIYDGVYVNHASGELYLNRRNLNTDNPCDTDYDSENWIRAKF